VQDQRHDLFVEECAALPPAEYIQEIEEVEETILVEVDEQEDDEAFEFINDHDEATLFDDRNGAQESSLPQDLLSDIIDDNVRDAYDDDLADIPMDATTHQGFEADANFNYAVLEISF
jgi:hypothetical protein